MAEIKKEWKQIDWADPCPNCGGSFEVFTEVGLPDGHAYDCDRSCIDCINCKLAIHDDKEYECELVGMLWGDYDICNNFEHKGSE